MLIINIYTRKNYGILFTLDYGILLDFEEAVSVM